ncbi:MFS transporter [Lampropedia aestuarii]|uniref:MFS transporter n=1 Tax=Lampropedia aestuarii TaxID=2562762 RepID=UPI0024689742|nr:MFS transporter [Lampropedia aestuarii]MDH5858425.1 MFS transporter [Lampropedia aestuarii]
MTPLHKTSWRNIALAIVASLVASFQIGKAIIALPLLQAAPLHLSLTQTGMVISALAIVGAFFAMPLGVLIARLDARKVLTVGLLVVAASSFAGSQADHIVGLLVSRVLEGVAVVVLLVCASSVVGRQAHAADRDLAMALSSTAVPSGIALVICATTLAAALGFELTWSCIWMVNAVLALAYAPVVWLGLPRMPPLSLHIGSSGERVQTSSIWGVIGRVATTRKAQLIAIGFGLYAIVYFAFSGFLPLLLRDLLALTPIQAGFASGAIVATNVLGNLGAGALMRRGVAPRHIVAGSFGAAAVCIPVLFWLSLPPVLAAFVSAGMIGCMGATPGALSALAPRVAPEPALVAPTIGLMLQGSYLGQVIGPMSAGGLAQLGGWTLVACMLLPLALAGVLVARKL